MNLRELRRRLAELVAQARGILNTAQTESRDLTDEERTQYDGLTAEMERLEGDIRRLERLEGAAGVVGQRGETPNRPEPSEGLSLGLSAEDLRRYSLVRAIRAMATGDWRGAEFERECSDAMAERIGRAPQGFFVPYDWQRAPGLGRGQAEARDLQAGTPSAGGYLVDTDLLAASFIELLRNRMVVRVAGARVLSGLVGDVDIPKQTGGATAYWLGEGGAPTESQQTLGQVVLRPKTVGAYTDVTRRLLKQSSLDVEMFVRDDLATVLALAIDYVALHGPGAANQPLGVAGTSGIGSVAGGTDGLAPAWSHIVDLETEVAVDNADLGRLAYITNSAVRGVLKQVFTNATYGEIPVWTNTPTPGVGEMNGYPAHATNQVSSTLTKGTSSGVCSAIFFGNWADLIIGMWGVLDILVDPYTHSTSGSVRVVALQDVDVAVRHAESFAAMLDALTA
jgi:HK97 family phage major capsid protein